jgi:hypothetical protein
MTQNFNALVKKLKEANKTEIKRLFEILNETNIRGEFGNFCDDGEGEEV